MQLILEKLKANHNRETTKQNYLSIWRNFNNFVIRLDKKPHLWEDKASLFFAYLIDKGAQSSTIKSYKSAIKSILIDDGYDWRDNRILLNTLTRACKLQNDRVRTRLPIKSGLLELILFEVERICQGQEYLICLHQAILILGYYGLFRVGELTTGDHPIKAKDVHVATNKEKILVVLYSSKTHSIADRPQKVKIVANTKKENNGRIFCPFKLMRRYMAERGDYTTDREALFVFRDSSPVKPNHVRSILNTSLTNLGLDSGFYGVHSLRIGRSTQLVEDFKQPISVVKRAGRWSSNVIYKYLRN